MFLSSIGVPHCVHDLQQNMHHEDGTSGSAFLSSMTINPLQSAGHLCELLRSLI